MFSIHPQRFQAYSTVFCLLVVFTGSCYSSLALVSSNVCGLKILSSGLTRYELKQLLNIKIFGTIVLENLPQLTLQILYAYHQGMTQAVFIAFLASILSVISTVLSYLFDKNWNEVIPVQYYLSVKIRKIQSSEDDALTVKPHRTKIIKQPGDDLELGNPTMQNDADYMQLTENEIKGIMDNKGKTKEMGELLAALYKIQPKNIEIGATLIHRSGVDIHIIHYVYKSEIDLMQKGFDKEEIQNIAQYYTRQIFTSLKKEISVTLLNHFKLEQPFHLFYYDLNGYRQRGFMHEHDDDETNDHELQNVEDAEKEQDYDLGHIELADLVEKEDSDSLLNARPKNENDKSSSSGSDPSDSEF